MLKSPLTDIIIASIKHFYFVPLETILRLLDSIKWAAMNIEWYQILEEFLLAIHHFGGVGAHKNFNFARGSLMVLW